VFPVVFALGRVRAAHGALEEAWSLFDECDRLAETFGDVAAGVRFQLRIARGVALCDHRRYGDAEALFAEARAWAEMNPGPGELDLAPALGDHAEALIGVGRLDEAEDANRRAGDIRRRQLNADHPDLAWTLWNEGEIHRRRGRIAEAEAALRASLKLRERTLGPDHRDTAAALHALGSLLAEGERRDEARALLTRALEIRRKSPGPDHPHTAETAVRLEALGAV
jgi:tetratricopeptide (TPR) repeat protein